LLHLSEAAFLRKVSGAYFQDVLVRFNRHEPGFFAQHTNEETGSGTDRDGRRGKVNFTLVDYMGNRRNSH
jgi:hypothetical protein